LAYVFGRRQDDVFVKLKALLEPFGITKYYTDAWGAYTRHIEGDQYQPGKRNTQQIEWKHPHSTQFRGKASTPSRILLK
jgi:insertion element IS1 protein InsB